MFFEKINEIDKPLTRLIKKKRGRPKQIKTETLHPKGERGITFVGFNTRKIEMHEIVLKGKIKGNMWKTQESKLNKEKQTVA